MGETVDAGIFAAAGMHLDTVAEDIHHLTSMSAACTHCIRLEILNIVAVDRVDMEEIDH